MTAHTWNARTQEAEAGASGVQSHPGPHSKLEANLNGMRPCLKTNQREERGRVKEEGKGGEERKEAATAASFRASDFCELIVAMKVDFHPSCFD